MEQWEVGTQELRLYVQAAARMTPAQREAFTNVVAPLKVRSLRCCRRTPVVNVTCADESAAVSKTFSAKS